MSWHDVVRRAKAATTELSALDVIERSIKMTPSDLILYAWKKAARDVRAFSGSPRTQKKIVEVIL